MPEARIKQIMQQVVQAACHSKDRGVFHRDIQLRNVLLNTQTMEVKLIDFGLGCLQPDSVYKDSKGNSSSGMNGIGWSVMDQFCDLADATFSLSYIQPIQFPSHWDGSL